MQRDFIKFQYLNLSVGAGEEVVSLLSSSLLPSCSAEEETRTNYFPNNLEAAVQDIILCL